MRLTRCDNCGTEREGGNWFRLEKLTAPTMYEGGFFVGAGRQEFDLCSPKCIEEKTRTFYTPEQKDGE